MVQEQQTMSDLLVIKNEQKLEKTTFKKLDLRLSRKEEEFTG